ncbi:hypothetical protein NQ317_017514 [Molorchus minor]|uniref:R3H domain-containing protein n=1 Tax=Molorchus minor TaxID=1323400 RepID=A0ABQ9JNS2_9CUCU|nr:hypothetical protein NQ317_017514 [Molorchus minor]
MEEKHDISDPSIDEILNRLSTKFNRIFYDREFVCCVHEDFQVILKNKDKCCVVVFPVLGPSYLKAVRYQAKIFDLAVLVLGTGTTRFIAVCQKEFLKKKDSEVTEDIPKQIMPEGASEGSCINTRKKRPERQLYVPPAQRRLPSRDELTKKCHSSKRRSINKKRQTMIVSEIKTYYQKNLKLIKYLNFKEQDGNDSCQLANKPAEQNKVASIKSSANILKERGTETSVQLNNIKNTIPNSSITVHDVIEKKVDHDKNSHDPKKSSEHEQEKEIMRIAKKNINRKTRPIIKYVDDSNNTLNISKNDNVNNWEDLFDDNGHIQEELFKEITHKVGPDVTIVKAKEDYTDYSEYITKQSEELEHMVELYDFPSTLGTQDIIQAFSDIRSDAMYIKWVDDTHAILHKRAIELDNPLIKVRPMTVASGMTLATAYKHDLKPAMKRPQTNLQTARRLITTHLGTKSQISREQTAKEREMILKLLKLKRLVRKNEQDAWEGNLRSSAS